MKDRILAFLKEQEAITEELKTILPWCDNSPIVDCLDRKWLITDTNELQLGIATKSIIEYEDYYEYEISSMSALGKELFIGEKDDITYIMAHDGDWENTQIFMLDNKNREYEQ